MDTIVVKMPAVLERLGQLRARGTGVLSRKMMTDQQRNGIGALLGEMEGLQRYQSINLEKVMTHAPATRTKLEGAAKAFEGEVAAIVARINQDILSGALEANPQEYFNATTALIDKGYGLMTDILVPELQRALQARSAGEAIRRIKDGAERVRVDIRSISDALREQSESSNQIARNVEDIARMTQENSAAVQDTAHTAAELERLARELQTEVQRFRV